MCSAEFFGNRFWSAPVFFLDDKIPFYLTACQCNEIRDTAMVEHPSLNSGCIFLQPRDIKCSPFVFKQRFPFCMCSAEFYNRRFWGAIFITADYKIPCNNASGKSNKTTNTATPAHPSCNIGRLFLQP